MITQGRGKRSVLPTALVAGAALLAVVRFVTPKTAVAKLKTVNDIPHAISGIGAEYAPDYHVLDMDAHLQKRKKCKWQKFEKLGGPVDGYEHLTYAERKRMPIDPFLDEQYESFTKSREFLLEKGQWRCVQPHEGDPDTFDFIDRYGPFVTTGGEDWVSMWFSDLGGLSELPVVPGESLHLTKGAFTPMTHFGADGTPDATPEFLPSGDDVPVPHPPINPHHWHLNTGPNWDHRNEADQYVLYQAHSDNSQCKGIEGVGCYGFDLPEGLGFTVSKDNRGKHMLWTTGSWLDVRKPDSPPMWHWLEFSATVTSKRMAAPVDAFAIIGVPWPMGLQLSVPREEYLAYRADKKWVEHFNEMLFLIPPKGASLYWASIQGIATSDAVKEQNLADCATIVSWRWHQHGRSMLKDMWLMRGTGEQLGLPQMVASKEAHVEVYTGMYLSGPPGNAVSLVDANVTVDAVKTHLKATGSYVCEFPLTHPDKWEPIAEDDFWPGVTGKEYPRHVKLTCPAVTLYPGDALTTVSFYDPPASDMIDTPYSGLMTGQHGMLEAFQLNGVCDPEVYAARAAGGVDKGTTTWLHDW